MFVLLTPLKLSTVADRVFGRTTKAKNVLSNNELLSVNFDDFRAGHLVQQRNKSLTIAHSTSTRDQSSIDAQVRQTSAEAPTRTAASATIKIQAGLGLTVTRSVPEAATISTARFRFSILMQAAFYRFGSFLLSFGIVRFIVVS